MDKGNIMAGKTVVVFSCAHVDPSVSNERLGEFLYDLKPDYVVDLGDGADMRSLNTFDTRYPEAIVSQSYEADIEHYNDAQERIRWKFRHHRRKRPAYIGFEGNHENRIKKAIKHDPRIADYDGVSYAHFFSSGNFGSAMSGMHHANALLAHRHHSSTCGHSHKRDLKFKDASHPNGVIGLVAGCYKGAAEGWAGQANKEWWSGIVVKREVENGMYDPEFVSQSRLKAMYGQT
jgi:predicted phosphodiesterase